MLTSFICCLVACICLSLSQQKHYQTYYRVIRHSNNQPKRLSKTTNKTLRALGYIALMVSLKWSLDTQYNLIGLVYWFGLVTFSALVIAMLLAYSDTIKAP